MLLDTAKRQSNPDTADNPGLPTLALRLTERPDQELVRGLCLFGDDRGEKLDEPLVPVRDTPGGRTLHDRRVDPPPHTADLPPSVGDGLPAVAVNDHVSNVGVLDDTSNRGAEELLVLRVDAELAARRKLPGHGLTAFHELGRHDSAMLADTDQAVDDETDGHDRNERPEDPEPEGGRRSHGCITVVALVRTPLGTSTPSFCAALRLTVRFTFRAVVDGTSAAVLPPRTVWASSPAWRPMSSLLANDSERRAPIWA